MFRVSLLLTYISICILRSTAGFSWNNCGSGTDLLVFQNLAINPDQVNLPGIKYKLDYIFKQFLL